VALPLTPLLRAMLLKPHTGHVKKRGPLAILLHLFGRFVENITGGSAGILRRIVTLRARSSFVIMGFGVGISSDVYARVGLAMLVGLLGKNAILIIEFAVQRHREGLSIPEAAIAGGEMRFRPILLTSFAFSAGLLPLVVATGPGEIGNRTIGTAAVGGMLVGTLIGVLVIPGLYYLFGRIADKLSLLKDETDEPLSELFEHKAHA
jgi:multidrug efflux pump subunit AcrB